MQVLCFIWLHALVQHALVDSGQAKVWKRFLGVEDLALRNWTTIFGMKGSAGLAPRWDLTHPSTVMIAKQFVN